MANVYLNRKISRRVENGHPWIFGNEIEKVEGDAAGGGIVDVFTFDKKFVGRGYINMQSQIAVRLLTRNRNEEINDEFFLQPAERCLDLPAAAGLYGELPAGVWGG